MTPMNRSRATLLVVATLGSMSMPLVEANAQSGGEPLSCESLIIPWEDITERTVDYLYVDTSLPVTFEKPSDPVVAVRLGLPLMLDPSALVCGEDFEVFLDAGVVTLNLYNGTLPYFVELTHASGALTAGMLWPQDSKTSDADPIGTPPSSGSAKKREFEVPASDVVFVADDSNLGEDRDLKPVGDWHDEWEGKTECLGPGSELVPDVTEAVCAAFAANGNQPVEVTFVSHGTPGGLVFPSGFTQGPLTLEQACALGEALKDKVSDFIFLACYWAGNDAGVQLMQKLNSTACANVYALAGSSTHTCAKERWWHLSNSYKLFIEGQVLVAGDNSGQSFQVAGEQSVVLDGPGPQVPLVLPFENVLPNVSILEASVQAVGSSDMSWDFDGNGLVDLSDTAALLELAL